MQGPDTMHGRLRRATRALHDSVEASIALGDQLGSRADYRALLERFYGLYRPLDDWMTQADPASLGLDPTSRRKSLWLAADLADLGVSHLPGLAQGRRIPPLPTGQAGLGLLYVVEGSSLGGQVILRMAGSRLGIRPDWAGRFFASYGPRVGIMWREFLAVLDRVDPASREADAIEAAARTTFALFDDWLGSRTPGKPTALAS